VKLAACAKISNKSVTKVVSAINLQQPDILSTSEHILSESTVYCKYVTCLSIQHLSHFSHGGLRQGKSRAQVSRWFGVNRGVEEVRCKYAEVITVARNAL